MKICYLVERIGPYHAARLDRAGARGEVVAIELQPDSDTYAWQTVADDGRRYRREAVAGTRRTLGMILRDAAPDVVFLNGWADRGARAALRWCVRRGVPAALMSDSQREDEPRVFWKEWVKRGLLTGCRAAFVAGERHAEYLRVLGFGARPITKGYDVVDNNHFRRGAGAARGSATDMRARLGLPERYFLCVSRFVPKKNLLFLIRAFAAYRQESGPAGWNLVLLGDGEQRAQIEAEIARAGLNDAVLLPGFQQYENLPAYYGLAGALVLASTTEQWGLVVNEGMAADLPLLISNRCGCVPELVTEGTNGWTFNPSEEVELTRLLDRLANCSPDELAGMGAMSRRIIDNWSLDHFADGLWQAAEHARQTAATRPWTGPGVALRRALLALLAPAV